MPKKSCLAVSDEITDRAADSGDVPAYSDPRRSGNQASVVIPSAMDRLRNVVWKEAFMTSNLLRAAMIAMAVVSMVGGAGEASAALNEEPEVQHFFSPALTIHFKGLTVRNEDVVRFVPATDEAEIVFNGSAFGLSWENVDSVVAQADGTFLLSFKTTAYLPGFGYVEDEDVVQFTPDESDPANAGTFSIFLKGDDIGIFGYRTDINAFSTNTGTQTCDLELFLSPPEDDDAIIQRAKDICRIVFALGTEPDPFICLDPIDSAICNVIEGFGCSGLLQP